MTQGNLVYKWSLSDYVALRPVENRVYTVEENNLFAKFGAIFQ